MKNRYVLDRIESGWAICETSDQKQIQILLSELYPGSKEGDHFAENEGNYYFLPEETEEARSRNAALLKSLWES